MTSVFMCACVYRFNMLYSLRHLRNDISPIYCLLTLDPKISQVVSELRIFFCHLYTSKNIRQSMLSKIINMKSFLYIRNKDYTQVTTSISSSKHLQAINKFEPVLRKIV